VIDHPVLFSMATMVPDDARDTTCGPKANRYNAATEASTVLVE